MSKYTIWQGTLYTTHGPLVTILISEDEGEIIQYTILFRHFWENICLDLAPGSMDKKLISAKPGFKQVGSASSQTFQYTWWLYQNMTETYISSFP